LATVAELGDYSRQCGQAISFGPVCATKSINPKLFVVFLATAWNSGVNFHTLIA